MCDSSLHASPQAKCGSMQRQTLHKRYVAILNKMQEGKMTLIKKDGGEILIAIVLDKPLSEAQALVDDPDAFVLESSSMYHLFQTALCDHWGALRLISAKSRFISYSLRRSSSSCSIVSRWMHRCLTAPSTMGVRPCVTTKLPVLRPWFWNLILLNLAAASCYFIASLGGRVR